MPPALNGTAAKTNPAAGSVLPSAQPTCGVSRPPALSTTVQPLSPKNKNIFLPAGKVFV